MRVQVNNVEKEVTMHKKENVWVCRVGNTRVYWDENYPTPYIIMPGKNMAEVNQYRPYIVAYLREYTRIMSIQKNIPMLSYEGEALTSRGSTHTGTRQEPLDNVSGIPKWLRERKIKQLCSGPKRTYERRVKIPQEDKVLAKKYIAYCCNCVHRVECDAPCNHPEINSKETTIKQIESEDFNMAKVYGVKVGYQTGVFTTWADCEKQVKGYPGAQYKGFTTKEAAEEYVGVVSTTKPIPVPVVTPATVNSKKKSVTLYTDGACSGNPGPGGWGAILMFGEHYREYSGHNVYTTNNKMELTAIVEGLSQLKFSCDVTVYSDSKYAIEGMSKWLDGWKKKGWKTSSGPVKNKELWESLDRLAALHTITWCHVKGHADNKYNNRCDQLATGAIRR